MDSPKKVLTIAGSDSGGAAGLQADLKTLTALGVYGMSVVTAVTAQNSTTVSGVTWMTPQLLNAQFDAVLSDYGADAVKTGFLGQAELIVATSAKLQQYKPQHIIIDPVLVNHRGQSMFPSEVTDLYRNDLLPLATIITPNRHEAALLTNQPLPESTDLQTIRGMAKRLQSLGPRAVLIKGGRRDSKMVDILFDGDNFTEFESDAIETENTHGAGDTLSAAICAFLAKGDGLETPALSAVEVAVSHAHTFTNQAISRAKDWRLGAGHGPLSHFLE